MLIGHGSLISIWRFCTLGFCRLHTSVWSLGRRFLVRFHGFCMVTVHIRRRENNWLCESQFNFLFFIPNLTFAYEYLDSWTMLLSSVLWFPSLSLHIDWHYDQCLRKSHLFLHSVPLKFVFVVLKFEPLGGVTSFGHFWFRCFYWEHLSMWEEVIM